jgi:hypothetical protein
LERANTIERICERWFERWRSRLSARLTTNWNYAGTYHPTAYCFLRGFSLYCVLWCIACNTLRSFLQGLEAVEQKLSEGIMVTEEGLSSLRNTFGGLYGFPLNFSDAGYDVILHHPSLRLHMIAFIVASML